VAASTGVLFSGTISEASTPHCNPSTYYWGAQESNADDFSGIQGTVTDPGVSTVQGNSSNQDDGGQHLLEWMELLNLTIPHGHTCGAANTSCWQQMGVGMGYSCWGGYNCDSSNNYTNYTNNFQVYYEDVGAGGADNVNDNFYPSIPIQQNAAPWFTLFYDGMDGYTGSPQDDGFVIDDTGAEDYVNQGELYEVYVHVEASEEAEMGTDSVTTCPTLTNGSPYQNFGTDYYGDSNPGDELQLGTGYPQTWSDWSGAPVTFSSDWYWPDGNNGYNLSPQYFWYDETYGYPDEFQTNGPSASGT